jgi:hypothetical protein
MEEKGKLENIKDIFNSRMAQKKPPAHDWQDLALRVIKELSIPDFKRGSVFKICKEISKREIEQSLNDTKELCKSGLKWKYFFKVISSKQSKNQNLT